MLVKDGRRIGIECKRSDAPRLTPSMRTSLAELELDRLVIMYPGARRYSLAEGVDVLPLAELSGVSGR